MSSLDEEPKATSWDGISGQGAEGEKLRWHLRTKNRRRLVCMTSHDEDQNITISLNINKIQIFKVFF